MREDRGENFSTKSESDFDSYSEEGLWKSKLLDINCEGNCAFRKSNASQLWADNTLIPPQALKDLVKQIFLVISRECGKITDPSEARTHDP